MIGTDYTQHNEIPFYDQTTEVAPPANLTPLFLPLSADLVLTTTEDRVSNESRGRIVIAAQRLCLNSEYACLEMRN